MKRMKSTDLDDLRSLHKQMAAAKKDWELVSKLDVAFHRGIAVATRNPLFVVVLDSIEPALTCIPISSGGRWPPTATCTNRGTGCRRPP